MFGIPLGTAWPVQHFLRFLWSVFCQEYLDVSNNKLERFPPSTEQFWSGSLTYLFLNNNNLDQIDENILKLGKRSISVAHSEHHFPAPSSKLCQIWLHH